MSQMRVSLSNLVTLTKLFSSKSNKMKYFQCSQVFLGRYRQFLEKLQPISPHANIARNRQISPQNCSISPQIRQFYGRNNAKFAKILPIFDKTLPISRKFPEIAEFQQFGDKKGHISLAMPTLFYRQAGSQFRGFGDKSPDLGTLLST